MQMCMNQMCYIVIPISVNIVMWDLIDSNQYKYPW